MVKHRFINRCYNSKLKLIYDFVSQCRKSVECKGILLMAAEQNFGVLAIGFKEFPINLFALNKNKKCLNTVTI